MRQLILGLLMILLQLLQCDPVPELVWIEGDREGDSKKEEYNDNTFEKGVFHTLIEILILNRERNLNRIELDMSMQSYDSERYFEEMRQKYKRVRMCNNREKQERDEQEMLRLQNIRRMMNSTEEQNSHHEQIINEGMEISEQMMQQIEKGLQKGEQKRKSAHSSFEHYNIQNIQQLGIEFGEQMNSKVTNILTNLSNSNKQVHQRLQKTANANLQEFQSLQSTILKQLQQFSQHHKLELDRFSKDMSNQIQHIHDHIHSTSKHRSENQCELLYMIQQITNQLCALIEEQEVQSTITYDCLLSLLENCYAQIKSAHQG